MAWAMESGKDLRAYMTQRYGSSMVFMSLLLSTELAVLFNSAAVTTNVRAQLRQGNHQTISFWAGFMIIISALLTILSLISLFTAWGMVNSIDEVNAHCIFRSSIGQYAAELPGRLIVCSIYSFLIAFMMFFFLLLPLGPWSLVLLGSTAFLFIHIVSTFSAFGRVIMHTGAMGSGRIFSPEYEEFLLPHSLHANLLAKAQANLANNTSIIRQYRRKQQPIDRSLTAEQMYDHLSGKTSDRSGGIPEDIPYRPRADSTVRFADVELDNNKRSAGGSGNYHHYRSLTPLSDISSGRGSNLSSILDDNENPPSSLRKSSFSVPPPPRRPTPPPPMIASQQRSSSQQPQPQPPTLMATTSTSSVGNVSTASLEQWLQASSGNVAPVKPQVSVTANTPTDLSNGLPIIADASPSASPSKSTTTSTTTTSLPRPPMARQLTPADTTITAPGRRPHTNSAGTLTSEQSELSFEDYRDMSEEERFAMDYGMDFGDDESELPPKFASEYKLLSSSTPNTASSTLGGRDGGGGDGSQGGSEHDSVGSRGGERQGLLDRANPTHFYSTMTSNNNRHSQRESPVGNVNRSYNATPPPIARTIMESVTSSSSPPPPPPPPIRDYR